MMQVTGVQHVQIAVPPQDEAAALRFYGELLELKRIPKSEGANSPRGGWFLAGTMEVHIGVQERDFAPAEKAHVAFTVSNLPETREALERAGFATVDARPVFGAERFFTQDPAGNRLEFMQDRRLDTNP